MLQPKDNTTRRWIALIAFILLIIFQLLAAWQFSKFASLHADFQSGDFLRKITIQSEYQAAFQMFQLVVIARSIVGIGVVVAFCMWLYRAYRNLENLGYIMVSGSGWAVGCWFIPGLNFVRPYSVMKDLIETSFNTENRWGGGDEAAKAKEAAGEKWAKIALGVWWGAFILYVVGVVVTAFSTSGSYNIELGNSSINANGMHPFAVFEYCLAAFLTAFVIFQVGKKESRLEELWANGAIQEEAERKLRKPKIDPENPGEALWYRDEAEMRNW